MCDGLLFRSEEGGNPAISTVWKKLEGTLLNEIRDTEKQILQDLKCMWNLKRVESFEAESGKVVIRGWGGKGRDWTKDTNLEL